MSQIPVFMVNHLRVLRGIYVSRKDKVGSETITSFVIQMKEPNFEPVLGQGANHTIEHIGATFLRDDPEWKDRIIYWGPTGCLTSFFLLVHGDYEPSDILDLMKRTFAYIADFEGEIPGATPESCGNWLLHDLPMARFEAGKYLHETLETITEAQMHYRGQ